MAEIIPFPGRSKAKVIPIRTGYDFEREYREALDRIFRGQRPQADRPCDSEPEPA